MCEKEKNNEAFSTSENKNSSTENNQRFQKPAWSTESDILIQLKIKNMIEHCLNGKK